MNTSVNNPDPFAAPSSMSSDQHVGGGYQHNHQPFYAPSGRIGRVRFLAYGMISTLILMGITFVVGIVVAILVGALGENSAIATLLSFLMVLIVSIGSIYISIVLAIRRLNDLNMSGWLSLIMLILIISAIVKEINNRYKADECKYYNCRLNESNTVTVVEFADYIFWLYLVFAPGNEGMNQYGAPAEPPTTLMTVLAVFLPIVMFFLIGILAAIALPAYQEYVERAQSAALMNSTQP